jgi:hypothetical protein
MPTNTNSCTIIYNNNNNNNNNNNVSEITVGLLKSQSQISLLDKPLNVKYWQKGDW